MSESNLDDGASVSEIEEAIFELKSRCEVLLQELEIVEEFVVEAEKEADGKAAQVELEDLKSREDKYFQSYNELIHLCKKGGVIELEYTEMRRKFVILTKKLKIRLMKLTPDSRADTTAASSRLKFAKIDFEIFDGSKDADWGNFKKLFIAYIHDNKELSNFEKHQFLRSKLKGDPAMLVGKLPFDGACYETAWKVLLEHYDDPMKRIARHMDSMFKFQAVKGSQLRSLIVHFRSQVTALSIAFQENPNIDILSQFCIYSFLMKTDKGTRLDWEREMEKRQKFANFDEFIKFMEGRCNAYERAVHTENKSTDHAKGTTATINQTSQSRPLQCYYCQEGHRTHQCPKFLELSPEDRSQAIRKRRLCLKCFRGKCDRSCRFKCTRCNGHHNTLLHFDKKKEESKSAPKSDQIADKPAKQDENQQKCKSLTLCSQNLISEHLELNVRGWVFNIMKDVPCSLLATASVFVSNFGKNEMIGRTLLDPGSHFNFISTRLANLLRCNRTASDYRISGIQNMSTSTNQTTVVQIRSRIVPFKLNVKCLIIEEIISMLPLEHFSIDDWHFPNHLSLADPKFNIPQPVDLLLGASVFWKILKPQTTKIKNISSQIFASQLGWLVAGELTSKANLSYTFFAGELELNKTIERLWFLDDSTAENLTFEEQECEEHFLKNYERDIDGRFIVRLPLKIPRENLGESKPQALKRFYNLEKRLDRNTNLKKAYVDGIDDYIRQGHMKLVNDIDPSIPSYYIPHQIIFKEDSTSTKFRIVFDASAPTTTGLSLNNCLMVGPVVQSDLFSILIRSRMYNYVFSSDISQMYRQIKVHHQDTPLLRILWRTRSENELEIYELITVPFGLASSPFLATRCLNLLADLEGGNFRKEKKALLNDCYIDNVFSGAESIEDALKVKNQLTCILEKGGFPLKKWCSNHPQILSGIPPENLEKKFPLYFGNEHVIKTLGLIWFPLKDEFKIWVHVKKCENATKREVLSIISSIFDPFGILAPVTVMAKLFMQALWHERVKWDEILNEKLLKDWNEFSSQLPSLETISIPRHVLSNKKLNFIELHGFCDASEKAYGCAIYIRSSSSNHVVTHLLCAKTRVAPLKKTISMARLELCGAVLLIELINSVKSSLKDWKIDRIRAWCDSQITLCWINSPHSRWLPFVANRVKKIQEKQGDVIWDYIKTENNPADVLSRGVKPLELKDNFLWWYGPNFLKENSSPFSSDVIFKPSANQSIEVRQARKVFVGFLPFKSDYFDRFSSYSRMLRITVWILRFIWNLHWLGPHLSGPVQAFEFKQATAILIKIVQKEHFSAEMKNLSKNQSIEKNSRLASLSPFLDADGVIRVGGRLEHSYLSFEQRHQIVLPQSSKFTALLINYEHIQNMHAAAQALKSILRRKFWILRMDSSIQHCIIKCKRCCILKADTRVQMMSSLPKARVVPGKVFQTVGVDYAGPFFILDNSRRKSLRQKNDSNKDLKKTYIAVFVCFTTKALHLELVSDLSTETFLAAFDRFMGRRGLPSEIWSDNGTNFQGANSELKKLFNFFKIEKDKIISYIALKGCSWHFIPPLSPSFGGLWEAGVKSVKSHLKAVIGESLFTYEQYETLLIKIESCLNSRPLFVESSDPNSPTALTPGHFLIGGPITALPNPDITNVPINRLKYWQLVTQKMQEFWKRWSNEYLHTLQQRNKWKLNKNEIKVGQIVVVREDNTPPLHWPLAVIEILHPGSDGLVRVVTIRVRVGSFHSIKDSKNIKFKLIKRPVSRLIFLPSE